MNREAFKLRMQSLKSYRELNPGKGYLDWKALLLKDGGEVKAANPWLDSWNQQAYSTGKFEDQLGEGNLEVLKANRDTAPIYRSPLKYGFEVSKRIIDKNLPELRDTDKGAYTSTVMDMAKKVRDNIHEVNPNNTPGFGIYNEAANVIYSNDSRADLHEQVHASRALPQLLRIKEIVGPGTDEYWDHPDEIYARLMELRKGTGMDPTKRDYTIEDVRKMRQDRTSKVFVPGGVKKEDGKGLTQYKDVVNDPYHIFDRYTPELVTEIFNTVADIGNTLDYQIPMVAEGGEIPPKRTSYDRTNPYTGKPLATGAVNPVVDLAGAADFTPIGDAIAVKDTYQAAKEKDWIGMGLAAIGMLPLVPSGLRRVKKATKSRNILIPEVHPKLTENLIDSKDKVRGDLYEYLGDVATEKDRVLERVNTHAYRSRAQLADKMFGTNYNETYDLLNDLYENKFFDLPGVVPNSRIEGRARMSATPEAQRRFDNTGVGANPDDFALYLNMTKYEDPMLLATHEMNHYTDYLISRNPNTSINNNMLKSLEKSLVPVADDKKVEYFMRGTELKAFMNQLRAKMYDEGVIDALDYPVDKKVLEDYIKKLPDNSSIKKASKYHKDMKSYTKWFNSIPLLGVGLVGTNRYFNEYNSNHE